MQLEVVDCVSRPELLLSCEHGGNLVPERFQAKFADFQQLLCSHRGWDPGTRQLGEQWAESLSLELHLSTTTRLLIDLNRSEHHHRLFSEISRSLPAVEKEQIKAIYYRSHRQAIVNDIEGRLAAGNRVVHIALHSFTPALDGQIRTAEIGLLYDPRRAGEVSLCRQWQANLKTSQPQWRVRLNYPYRGTADGLTTTLRRQFSAEEYVGIELEVNQQLVMQAGRDWAAARQHLIATCHAALAAGPWSSTTRTT